MFAATHSDKLLFAEEAHADVVPELRALGGVGGCDAVLGQGDVEIAVALHHAARRHDGLRVAGVKGHCIAQVLKSLLELTNL